MRAAVCRHSPPPILTKGGFHKHPADALVNSEGPCGSASERFPVLLHKENALVISRRRVPAPPRLCGPSQPAASPPSPRRAQTGCSHSGPWSARNAPRPCSPFTHLRSWPETIDPRATWRKRGTADFDCNFKFRVRITVRFSQLRYIRVPVRNIFILI